MNDLGGYDIEDLAAGMHATFSKTITESDVVLFAGISGDSNAVHMNDEYAATTPFRGRIAHGFLTASVISAAVATRLPGPGTIYLAQQMKFRAPVRPGDTVHATVTVLSVDTVKARVVLSTVCRVKDTVVIDGEATVMTGSLARRLAAAAATRTMLAAPSVA